MFRNFVVPESFMMKKSCECQGSAVCTLVFFSVAILWDAYKVAITVTYDSLVVRGCSSPTSTGVSFWPCFFSRSLTVEKTEFERFG